MIGTKGEMIKQLKAMGIRKAEKEGCGEVRLEHLKYWQVCKLWQQACQVSFQGRLFVTGDTHGDIDYHKLATDRFPIQKELSKRDIMVICGDSAICWDGGKFDHYIQKWYESKNFTTLSILGNHENYDVIEKLPIVDFHGGKAYQVSDTVFYAINGEIYDLNGRKCFCFGGARSHDKIYRKEGFDWWSQEMPSMEEKAHGLMSLEQNDYKVDYVFTHCGPREIVRDKLGFETDELNAYFSFILNNNIQYKDWYMGHYHIDRDFPLDKDMKNVHILYDRIIELD